MVHGIWIVDQIEFICFPDCLIISLPRFILHRYCFCHDSELWEKKQFLVTNSRTLFRLIWKLVQSSFAMRHLYRYLLQWRLSFSWELDWCDEVFRYHKVLSILCYFCVCCFNQQKLFHWSLNCRKFRCLILV